MRNFRIFLVDENAEHLLSVKSQDTLIFARGQVPDEFKARVAARIRAEQDRVFLSQHSNLKYFWSKSLYAKIRVKARSESLQVVIGYKLDDSGALEGLVYGVLVDRTSDLVKQYNAPQLPWDQFPYDFGDRASQVLLCVSEENLGVETVLSADESPNAAYVAQVLANRPTGAVQGKLDELRSFEAQAPALDSSQEDNLYFLDEQQRARFERNKALLDAHSKSKERTAAQALIQQVVLSRAAQELPRSTRFSVKLERLEQFSRTVFSLYCEVVAEGEQERVQFKADAVLGLEAIRNMGLSEDPTIKQQLAILDDIKFVESVASTCRLLELAHTEILAGMCREIENICPAAVLRYTHPADSVVCFSTAFTPHDGRPVITAFSLNDNTFNSLVRNIFTSLEGCLQLSEKNFTVIRKEMERKLKQEATELLASKYLEAHQLPAQQPSPDSAKSESSLSSQRAAREQLPGELQFRMIPASTLLSVARAAYSGKSKYWYSTLFSKPRSKFMRELVAYLDEQNQTDLMLFTIVQEMNKRMAISDKCCGLFVSGDDRRGVDRVAALDRAQKGHGVSGLDERYRTDRAIKEVLAQFGVAHKS